MKTRQPPNHLIGNFRARALGGSTTARASRRATRIIAWGLGLALSGGCGSDSDEPATDTAADTSTADLESDVADVAPEVGPDAAPDTVAETSVDTAPDATPDVVLVGGCAEGQLERCAYPRRGLEVEVRDGIATVEPVTGRTLPLKARFPRVAGPLPVVIWSHGGGFYAGGQDKSAEWGTAFAQQGYAVIHVGHAALTATQIRAFCARADIPEAECVPSGEEDDDNNGLVALGRSFDLIAVLDDLERLSELSVDNDGPALDLTKVAVAGWSGGSRGPMMLMGARLKPTASAPVFTNPHALPVAALFMSPAGPGFGGWFEDGSDTSDHSWTTMRGPTFSATGLHDQKPNKPELTGEVRRRHFDLLDPDGERWLLYSNLPVGVGGHGTYDLADWQSGNARLGRLSAALASAALAFLDAHLRNDADAADWLASDNARVLAGDADYLHR